MTTKFKVKTATYHVLFAAQIFFRNGFVLLSVCLGKFVTYGYSEVLNEYMHCIILD